LEVIPIELLQKVAVAVHGLVVCVPETIGRMQQ
jgi:hypothetical protein